MFNNQEIFTPIVAPDEKHMRLRFPCPCCKWVDKASIHTHVRKVSKDAVAFSAFCPEHGQHTALLTETSKDFFDTNTPLRDVAKGAALISESKKENSLAVMVDGRDWSGRWNNLIFSEGITRLAYPFHELAKNRPPIFSIALPITNGLIKRITPILYI